MPDKRPRECPVCSGPLKLQINIFGKHKWVRWTCKWCHYTTSKNSDTDKKRHDLGRLAD